MLSFVETIQEIHPHKITEIPISLFSFKLEPYSKGLYAAIEVGYSVVLFSVIHIYIYSACKLTNFFLILQLFNIFLRFFWPFQPK